MPVMALSASASVVVFATVVMVILGLLFAVGLALASEKLRVERDARIDRILGSLPGVNCAACGFQGCEAYAEAVVIAGAVTNGCVPGGADAAKLVAEIMGVEFVETEKMRAVVLCQGGKAECKERFQYDGEPDCRAAAGIMGGPKSCAYGCLGFGTCAAVCPFGAIRMGEDGLPDIDPDRCTACGVCVKTCPREIIKLLPARVHVWVACRNPDKGQAVKSICSKGCIACRLCVKADQKNAITMDGNLPSLNYDAGSDFLAAAEKCPQGCFFNEDTGCKVDEATQNVAEGLGAIP